MTSRQRTGVFLAALAALLAVAIVLQIVRDRVFAHDSIDKQVLYVTNPEVMRRAALSYDTLLADVYWIRALQHYGGERQKLRFQRRYDLLYPLLDLTTSLDPNFNIAYEFGAFFLSEKKPGGPARSDLAITLLEKGMRARPDRWQYPYDIGFVHYRDGNYKVAADWFLRAAKTSGARMEGERADMWLEPLAANTMATGGDTRSSRVLYEQLLTSEVAWLREDAVRRLKKLEAIDQIALLERSTAEYERRFGDPPPTWQHMVQAGLLSGVPLDPDGHPYVLNPWWGEVTVSEDSPIWPLPTENPA